MKAPKKLSLCRRRPAEPPCTGLPCATLSSPRATCSEKDTVPSDEVALCRPITAFAYNPCANVYEPATLQVVAGSGVPFWLPWTLTTQQFSETVLHWQLVDVALPCHTPQTMPSDDVVGACLIFGAWGQQQATSVDPSESKPYADLFLLQDVCPIGKMLSVGAYHSAVRLLPWNLTSESLDDARSHSTRSDALAAWIAQWHQQRWMFGLAVPLAWDISCSRRESSLLWRTDSSDGPRLVTQRVSIALSQRTLLQKQPQQAPPLRRSSALSRPSQSANGLKDKTSQRFRMGGTLRSLQTDLQSKSRAAVVTADVPPIQTTVSKEPTGLLQQQESFRASNAPMLEPKPQMAPLDADPCDESASENSQAHGSVTVAADSDETVDEEDRPPIDEEEQEEEEEREIKELEEEEREEQGDLKEHDDVALADPDKEDNLFSQDDEEEDKPPHVNEGDMDANGEEEEEGGEDGEDGEWLEDPEDELEPEDLEDEETERAISEAASQAGSEITDHEDALTTCGDVDLDCDHDAMSTAAFDEDGGEGAAMDLDD